MQEPTDPSAPLIAWSLTAAELSGWPGRWLDVPAGHTALVVRDGRIAEALPPGRHTVAGWGAWLTGRAAGLEVAVLRTETVSAVLSLKRRANDEVGPANLWAQASFRIAEPARFYTAVLQPLGPVSAADVLDACIAEASHPLADTIQGWSVAASAAPTAAAELTSAIIAALAGPARNRGLHLEAVSYVALRSAEDDVMQERKLRELALFAERVRMEDAIDAAEVAARMLKLARQMEKDYDLPEGVLAGELEKPGVVASPAALLARVRELQQQAAQEPQRRLRQLADRLSSGPEPKPQAEPPRRWWFRYVSALRYGGALIYAVAFVLTFVQPDTRASEGWPNLIYQLAGIPFAGVMFITALQLDRKAAGIRADWQQHDLLAAVQGRVEKVDALVRQQLDGEYARTIGALEQLCERRFHLGQKKTALSLKRVVDHGEPCRARVANPAEGRPVYLGDVRLSSDQLTALLDHDEELLRAAADMSDAGTALLAADAGSPGGAEDISAAVADVDRRVACVDALFTARFRFMGAKTRPPAEDDPSE